MAVELWLSAGAAAGVCWVLTAPRRMPRDWTDRALEAMGSGLRPLAAWEPWAVAVREMEDAVRKFGRLCTSDEAAGILAVLGLCAGLGCGLLAWSWVDVPAGICGAVALLVPLSATWERRRSQRTMESLADAYRSLAGALATGRTLPQAVDYVGRHGRGDVGEAFEAAALELSCGASLEGALQVLANALPAGTSGLLVSALEVSQRTGAPLQGLLEQAAELMEERSAMTRALQTKTAQVRLSARVVMGLPVALVALLALVSADFRAGIATPVGLASLVLASALDGVALGMMRKIMKGAQP